MKDLKAQIAKRKQEAIDKRISWKAHDIVYGLGKQKDEDTLVYSDAQIQIEYGSGCKGNSYEGVAWFSCQIKVNGSIVYYEGGSDIISYVPGDWEDHMIQLLPQATKARKKKDKIEREEAEKRQQQLEDAERKNWGL